MPPSEIETRATGTRDVKRRGFLRLAGAGMISLSGLGRFTSPDTRPRERTRALGQSFFHASGRRLVSDASGEPFTFRGVNLNGLEFGTFFDNEYPGRLGTGYFRPRRTDFARLQRLGFNVVRAPFEWARLVPGWRTGDPLPTHLDPAYVALLDRVVERAAAHGLYVVLDLHDFFKYWSGESDQVCIDESAAHQELLAHTWKLLAEHFRDVPSVLAYDIVNEPVRREPAKGESCGSCNWHAVAQAIVTAIRTVDANHLILVEGRNYSLASDWPVENGRTPFVADTEDPPRIAYSPHIFFDFENSSRYAAVGEGVGPIGPWRHYVRDRLMPAIQWSIDNAVPLFFGELNVPCTPAWASVLDHVFSQFLAPLHISATAWHYIAPRHCELSACELNLAACPNVLQLEVLRRYPGGPHADEKPVLRGTPRKSLLFANGRVNPWDAGDGYWGEVKVDFDAVEQVFRGRRAIRVHFDRANFDGVKFIHRHGIDVRGFHKLRLWIHLTGDGNQDFRIFSTKPVPDCDTRHDPEYPAIFAPRPRLEDHLAARRTGEWIKVEIPLTTFVDPTDSVINGIALQNGNAVQDPFFLDTIELTR
jgi:endoglucanase